MAAQEFTVIYHGGNFKGRAEFLRLMLEDKGVPYSLSSANLYGPSGFCDAFRGSPAAVKALDNAPYPVFYPPGIWHRPQSGDEVHVNQVHACMVYLGETLGYAPGTAAERAKADSITGNALDFISDGRRSFHPVKNTDSYSNQKEEGDRVSKEFCASRMLLFLEHFEKILARNKTPTAPVAGGPGTTYADFALFHVLDATKSQFNTPFYGMAWDSADLPACKEFHAAFARRANLHAYFGTDRCPPWSGDSMM